MKSRLYHENGYTLMELIVVIFILSLISAIAVPSVNQLRGGRDLERTVQMMVADLHYMQQTAMAYGKTCRVEFYTQIEAYRLRIPGETRLVRLPEGINIAANTFPFSGSQQLLSFNRNGAPNSGGTVLLANERGDKQYVIVYLATGRIRISEEPPENW